MMQEDEDPKFDKWLKDEAQSYHSPLPTPHSPLNPASSSVLSTTSRTSTGRFGFVATSGRGFANRNRTP